MTNPDSALRARACAMLSPLPATPRLTVLAMRTLEAAESSTTPWRTIGLVTFAQRIAAEVAAQAGPTECLQIVVENDRVAALRRFQGEAGQLASVLDVARAIVAYVLTLVVCSALDGQKPEGLTAV